MLGRGTHGRLIQASWCSARWPGTCAKLCRAAGGELEQIQLLLGHASVQTTERYRGTKQDLVHGPNDAIKLRVAM
jgi:integrase